MEHKKKIAGYHSIIKQPSPPIEETYLNHPKSSLHQYKNLFNSSDEEKNSTNYQHQETVQTMYEKDLDSSSNLDIDKLGEQYGLSNSQLFFNNIDRLIYHLRNEITEDSLDSLSNANVMTKKEELTLKLNRIRKHNMKLMDEIEAISNQNEDKYMLSDSHLKSASELEIHFDKLRKKNILYKKQLHNANNNKSNDYYKKQIENLLENQLIEYREMLRDIKENNKCHQSYTEKRKENTNNGNSNNNNYDSRCDFEECWSITNQSNLSDHSIEKDNREGSSNNNIPYAGTRHNNNGNPNRNSNSNTNSNSNNNNSNINSNKRNDPLPIKSTRINGGIVSKDLCNTHNTNKNSNSGNVNHNNHLSSQIKYNMPSFSSKPNTNRKKYTYKK